MTEIQSISFFNPDARKAANPDEHPCPECGCEMWLESAITFFGQIFNTLPPLKRVCKCGYEEKVEKK